MNIAIRATGSSHRATALAGAALALTAAMLAGCAQTGSHPPAPTSVQRPEASYQIGPLDTLNIVVWRNPELSGPVTVRPDGFFSAPLVAEMRAAGLVDHPFHVGPGNQGARKHLHLLLDVGLVGQALHQRLQHGLGVDIDLGAGLVAVADQADAEHAGQRDRPGDAGRQPAPLPDGPGQAQGLLGELV